jgi:Spy/CpxP family protein refolding chaperone
MNNKLFITILIVSLAINLIAFTAFGFFFFVRHGCHGFKGHGPPWMAEGMDWHRSHLKKILELSDEQIDSLNVRQIVVKEKAKPIVQELFKKRKELVDLLKEQDPDSAEAAALFQEIVALQTELETMLFYHMTSMRDLFTEKQREKLIELLERRHTPPWVQPFEPGDGE